MAKPKDPTPPPPPTDALAPTAATGSSLVKPPTDDEAAALAVLDAAGLGEHDDGLGEVSANDLRTPLKLFNLKKAEGIARITQDQFLDTIDRAVSNDLHLVLLELHKTNLYAVFDKRQERNVTVCRSFDRVTGTYNDPQRGTYDRPCKGCPDAQWRTDAEGKRTVPCGEVWNVAAFDLDTQRVVLIKFRKTSLDSIRNHLQAHHIGRRRLASGKRGNIPLFAYRVTITLTMDKAGNYAIPVFARGDMLGVNDLRVMAETAAGVRETFAARMAAADESAGGSGDGGDAPDTSFDTDAYDRQAGGGNARGSEAFVDQ
jgi:hypothetical protein